jgi:hypothetical protein
MIGFSKLQPSEIIDTYYHNNRDISTSFCNIYFLSIIAMCDTNIKRDGSTTAALMEKTCHTIHFTLPLESTKKSVMDFQAPSF